MVVMKLLLDTPAELVVSQRPPLIVPLLFSGLGLAVVGEAVLTFGSMSAADLAGTALGATAAAFILVLVFRTRSEFRFVAASRELRWAHRRLVGESHGGVPLDSITGVAIEKPGNRAPRRVVVTTREGRLPLTLHCSFLQPDRPSVRFRWAMRTTVEQTGAEARLVEHRIAQVIERWLRDQGIALHSDSERRIDGN